MSQFIFWYIFLDKLLIIYILVCIFIVIPYYYIPYSLFKQTKKKKKKENLTKSETRQYLSNMYGHISKRKYDIFNSCQLV